MSAVFFALLAGICGGLPLGLVLAGTIKRASLRHAFDEGYELGREHGHELAARGLPLATPSRERR